MHSISFIFWHSCYHITSLNMLNTLTVFLVLWVWKTQFVFPILSDSVSNIVRNIQLYWSLLQLKSIWKLREGTFIVIVPGKQGGRGRGWRKERKRKRESVCYTNEVTHWPQIYTQILIYLDQARNDDVKLLKILAITEQWDCLFCVFLLTKNCSRIWTKVFPILIVNQISKHFNRFIENWPKEKNGPNCLNSLVEWG